MAPIRHPDHNVQRRSNRCLSIKTQRLQLREARESNLADFHEVFSSRDVMRFWAWPTHTSIDETKQYLHKMIASSTNGNIEFAIVLPAPGPLKASTTAVDKDKVIGTAGIWDEATGEIAFMLHQSYWNQGYMSEVLATLIPTFWERGVRKLVADVDPRNRGSIKVLNRFGFVETRREKKTCETDVGWCDSVFLELWRPRRF